MNIPEENVPEGWTTDPMRVQYVLADYWAGIASRCGLESPVALMCTTPESGDHYGFISAGGKYYFINELEYSILEILKPTILEEILKMMCNGRQRFIRMERLEEELTEEYLKEEEEETKKHVALMEKMRAEPGYLDWQAHDSDHS
ncbi:uncharacterized protein LDX57_004310 [Aspergillus melleus]|uniref:uncharacterized protein n=1 Tax=Aspergillus melleus TaxID=138277 RepID=UPI001E8EBC0D|nr:uncharacterized protein LDX57_004310 [Aspergillus melleus]KAH8426573.1 hypothetical protein LDX57_004310 [Aspergillus melleus]